MTTNRRILIDNATLSGVERILGISKTINMNNVGNDILCLEKLITAILFSDKLIGIDDYKEEFRSRRLQKFDFIDFKQYNEDAHGEIRSDAAAFAKKMAFSFDGSKPAGDVVSFFDALRIDPQMRWDVWCSSEYLTLSYLVNDPKAAEYERYIDSIFRNERTDCGLVIDGPDHSVSFSVIGNTEISNIESFLKKIASKNPNYSGVDGKSALNRIVFSYGWAAERSYFYNSIAERENSDICLAPLRDAFCESCLRIDHKSMVISLIEKLKATSQNTLVSILTPGGQAKFVLRLPFFTAFMISKTENPQKCIDLALEMRTNKDFQECRIAFHNLDFLKNSEKVSEINGILRYVEQ